MEETHEEAVIVHIRLSDDGFGSWEERNAAHELEDRIEEVVSGARAGGHEIGGGWCRFYLYGGSADGLSDLVFAALEERSLPEGSFLLKRYGPPGAPQKRVNLEC